MKKCLVLIVVALLLATVPAMAAKVTTVPITHETGLVYQAYEGSSFGADVPFAGYSSEATDDNITAVPGVLSIVPGEKWANFVGAAQETVPVSYTVKNVVLTKQTPEIIQCAEIFPAKRISQQGSANIRTWWPVMYEVPGTTWTLTVLYGTPKAYDDDGAGPNPAGYVHTEVWTWKVDATLDSLENLLALFHELPFGLDEVPLISDEILYPQLQEMLQGVEGYVEANDMVNASLLLGDFEMAVMDACISVSPLYPNPTGPGTGIANSFENPACCKILADVEYIGFGLGILQPGK